MCYEKRVKIQKKQEKMFLTVGFESRLIAGTVLEDTVQKLEYYLDNFKGTEGGQFSFHAFKCL